MNNRQFRKEKKRLLKLAAEQERVVQTRRETERRLRWTTHSSPRSRSRPAPIQPPTPARRKPRLAKWLLWLVLAFVSFCLPVLLLSDRNPEAVTDPAPIPHQTSPKQPEKNETKNRPPSVEEKPAFRPDDGEPKELPILDIKTEPEARPTPQQKQPDPAKQPENQPEDDGDAIDSLF